LKENRSLTLAKPRRPIATDARERFRSTPPARAIAVVALPPPAKGGGWRPARAEAISKRDSTVTLARRSPQITVGVPVYNGERFLAMTLESLLSQTVGDMVILVGDNASTDATGDITREYAARDSRIRHVRHAKNLGAARNYSVLCEMAQTEFFRWLAADDCSAPRFHEACLETLARHPDAVLAYPRIMMIDAQGRHLEEYDEGLHLPHDRPSERLFTLLRNLRLVNALYGVARTSVLKRTRLLGSFRGSDIVFLAELCLYGKILEIPELLMLRRMHEDSYTSMSPDEQRKFNNPDRSPTPEFYFSRHLAEYLRAVARAPVSARERARLLAGLARNAVWARDKYFAELMTAIRVLVRRNA